MITEPELKRMRRSDRALTYGFFAMIVIFSLLSWSIRNNQHRQQVFNWHQCQRSVTNTTKINDTAGAQITFWSALLPETKDPTSHKRLTDLIGIYQHSFLTVPTCGSKP